MIHVVFLDSGPLGVVTNPSRTAKTQSVLAWTVRTMAGGAKIIVPAIADFEVRRELVRVGGTASLRSLDAFNSLPADRYLPVTDSALKLAADLWATARNLGTLRKS